MSERYDTSLLLTPNLLSLFGIQFVENRLAEKKASREAGSCIRTTILNGRLMPHKYTEGRIVSECVSDTCEFLLLF